MPNLLKNWLNYLYLFTVLTLKQSKKMKILKYLLLLVLIVVIGGAIYLATLDGNYDIQRSKSNEGTSGNSVYAKVSDFEYLGKLVSVAL